MEVFKSSKDIRGFLGPKKRAGAVIGLVPTMGALHKGHMALIQACRQESDVAVVSVFVNPTQFGPNEDYLRYPRPFQDDTLVCQEERVNVLFAPDVSEVYPSGFVTRVQIEGLSEKLCGAFRPGHFEGVATVVLKLFNIISPDLAYFGEKDFQQYVILERMARDFNLPLALRAIPTVRDEDGLALSSRNAYLSSEERKKALGLYRSLKAGKGAYLRGERDPGMILSCIRAELSCLGLEGVDYVSLVDPITLSVPSVAFPGCRIMLAVRIGKVRLIDNVVL
jgi:pantoate--beta-alanine ligase